MKLQKPPAHAIPLGLRAMHTVATADSPLRPAARNLLEGVQRAFLGTDIAPESLEPVLPAELAAAVFDPQLRRQLVQGLLIFALADGPPSRAQMNTVDAFAEALGVEAPELQTLRLLADEHMGFFKLHFYRHSHLRYVAQRQLADEGLLAPIKGLLMLRGYAEDPKLAARYHALRELPEDTLGQGLTRYFDANGFAPPGEKGGFPQGAIWHDIGHVLTGFGTDPAGEVQMTAFQAGYMKAEPFYMLLFGAISFSAGINVTPLPQPNTRGILATEGLPERVFAALEKGSRVKVDLSDRWDPWPHFAKPLEEVRAELGLS